MFMVERIFHQGAGRLPIDVFSPQPTFWGIEGSGTATLKGLLFAACPGCLRTGAMCSIPQGVFAARQVRLNVENCGSSRPDVSSKDLFENQALEQPPLKYNSKLMNSIWGLYNRYSVHNFKKNSDDAIMDSVHTQQCRSSIDTAAQPEPTDASTATVGNSGLGASGSTPTPPMGGALNCRNLFVVALRAI